ncbi:DUF262 domain-containing protein [Helicobacter cinaedi]|uniref:DUF262 domain-containing protein n=3 Tax=Helicobacter cinaedi TaxID=213 RepID=A0AAI8MIL9_9HELI|nr:DUF262 domain-containing protein [Helicobacter cinaedi]AWK61842.1 DUF262 domain-containing protein [Helicobacter cinaedi]EFR46720.1 hypothetical protein HCCG_01267 [Helicobacter cinaedi CCUG 18818 = ATCC BAA-847]QOQ91744.1 DUF262 domain-containing protein [Helicobacter cinaedi]QOQ95945.1 DUF262 domain-containing protein [Helicobacter cinaedi]BAM32177.1 conserved hypothetical protein [Helicobacter cinaedi CCUG 18818 = ATCC BAA-847]
MNFKPEQKYIAKMLSEEDVKFIIPPYQRPYKWGINECETLWNDIVNAFNDSDDEYFLGSIIAFSEEKDEFQIIDGQQRITTFTLLFRAFYECFKTESNSEKEKGDFEKDFGKCLWEYKNDEGFDFDKQHLQSEVATEKEKENLNKILSDTIDENLIQKDNKKIKNNRSPYVQNYLYFKDKLEELKGSQTLSWSKFCNFVLGKNLFVLFVVCDSQESAMTIFNTLNSRGMPLSNADVLKGYLYKHYKEHGNIDGFINQWSEIEANIESVESNKDVNLDFLFLQYMHIIRAVNKDFDTTTPGLLDFFTKESKENSKKKVTYGYRDKWLYKSETMPFITCLTNFWLKPQNYLQDKSLLYMNVLFLFQNSSWKSFVSCLVWKNKEHFICESTDKNVISNVFEAPLLELLKTMSLLFINNQATTNTTDHIVFKLNVNLLHSISLTSEIEKVSYPNEENFLNNFNNIATRRAKYLLYLYAYIYDEFSQPIDVSCLEVEHILPKQWQNANFNGWNKESHKEYLEQIGNKILLPKKSNVKCTDNFFAQKKKEYADFANSHLKEVQYLANLPQNDWLKEDIKRRNKEIYTRLKNFFRENL